jgi:hypothetical protein
MEYALKILYSHEQACLLMFSHLPASVIDPITCCNKTLEFFKKDITNQILETKYTFNLGQLL